MRDMLVNIPDNGYGKMNRSAAVGGVELLLSTINQAFHMNLQDYVLVDFNMFEDVIDALGGVTVRMTAEEIREIGIRLAFVPEDRLGMGLVASMGMTGNMMLRSYKRGRGFFSERKQPRTLAERIMRELDVVTPGVEWPVGRMSGGNVQKVLVGREIASSPQVLMVAYPVRGLDINSSHTIYRLLNEQKKNGSAVICVGEDLDVLLALCDRILVLADGHVTGVRDARTVSKEEIGLLMTSRKEAQA